MLLAGLAALQLAGARHAEALANAFVRLHLGHCCPHSPARENRARSRSAGKKKSPWSAPGVPVVGSATVFPAQEKILYRNRLPWGGDPSGSAFFRSSWEQASPSCASLPWWVPSRSWRDRPVSPPW